ncbi:metal ABC transporter solute-binding protein, Zn/Mn family [Streptococcus sp. zg-JUN1979]|uniref:metal ABC transporter solute-binding protein, Zn/Mn family n=1 Tax=Streptococcus sp. zg-JUN1979 TaxID=3391450 RepID=UPI0039A43C94
MKTKLIYLLTVLLSLISLAFGSTVIAKADDKIEVVTTFYPVYAFTKTVVGDEANVSLLIKSGTEPHDFEPSTKDITTIQKADVFVYMDDNMETWVSNVKKSIGKDGPTFVKATEGMLLLAGGEEDHDHDSSEADHNHAYDPHVWLSPKRAITLVETIRDSFAAKYPDKTEIFTKNAKAYIEKLENLDKSYEETLSKAKQKSFVTQHTAFSYLALDYGLNQVAITGISAESEPTAKRLSELVSFVKKYGIRYIYFEETASSKVAKTLATEADVKTAVLNPIESLTTKQEKAGDDYISLMTANLKALEKTTSVAGKAVEEDKISKTVANGYFKTKDVKDRTLSDWSGNWQSVYPYLEDGTLDQVWDYKAKLKQDKTAKEYKDYYDTGYKTDVSHIQIDGKKNTITFTQNGDSKTFTYHYVGYEILTYQKGNRGVRYLFETNDADAGQFKYVQFSDHIIKPTKSSHFHIFWGDSSQEELLSEMSNWPTYYPASLTGHEVAQEMVAH